MSSENRGSESAEDRTPESAEDGHSTEETDVSPDSERPEDVTFDLHGPPSEDREASKWGGYALAALLAVVFLVGLLRLIDPAGTGLLIGALLALFGLAIGALAVRQRLR